MNTGQQHKICGVVNVPRLEEAASLFHRYEDAVDMWELRVDRLASWNGQELREALGRTSLPVILKGDGDFETLMSLQPEMIDLDAGLGSEEIARLSALSPSTRIIVSYHDFNTTPQDLDMLRRGLSHPNAAWVKIATQGNSILDAMRMMAMLKEHPGTIAFCMGEEVRTTRLIAPCLGSPITYVALGRPSASGQLTLDEITPFRHLRKGTALLGLIGDPVDYSPSRYTHQEVISRLELDAVYLRMRVRKEELDLFLRLAHRVGFWGLSVTMPLKESITVEPVNTLKWAEGTFQAGNTDGIGALRAIKKRTEIKGKRMVLLGAGGTAKAIAREAVREGCHLVILNRTVERARMLAESLGCAFGPLDSFPEQDYAVLVNTTPLGMGEASSLPVDPNALREGKLVLEAVSTPLETPFVHACREKKCEVVLGIEMFLEQAKEQFRWWFPQHLPHLDKAFEGLTERVP